MTLYPHQQRLLKATEPFNRCAYYVDMGLGKTYLGSEKMHALGERVNLLICQKSKITDWVQHIQRYYPTYKVIDITKGEHEESTAYETPTVLVINYELSFRRPWLLNLEGFTLILDESSLINNERAKRTKFILKLKAANVILLSGTPTSGKYERLWSQVKLLGWDISKRAFWNEYVVSELMNYGGHFVEVVNGYKNVDDLKTKLREYGAVFMKTSEAVELPQQVEQVIKLKPTRDYMRFLRDRVITVKAQNEKRELVGDCSLTFALYARQLCGQYHREKLQAFTDLLECTEDRIIVFYNFTEEYFLLRAIAQKAGRPVSVIRGGENDREAYNSFNNSVTFLQYQAGAMGINLQEANKVVYFTLPLGKGSSDLWEQSKKRIHRMGQERTCFYYYLLVNDSIETRNLEALREGKELTEELFRSQYGN